MSGMTPSQILAQMQALGITGAYLSAEGRPCGVLPSDGSLAVVRQAGDALSGPDEAMAEPLSLAFYARDGSGDGSQWERRPVDRYGGLAPAQVIAELAARM